MWQWAVNIKRSCPLLVCTGSVSALRRRKILSSCEGQSLTQVTPTDWSKASFLAPALRLLWISFSALNLIGRTEPRSVLRGNFCQGRLCRQWQEVRRWAVLLYLTLSSRCATARGERGEERTIRCGEEARPNKTCHQYYRKWEGPHRIWLFELILGKNLWDSMEW